MTDNRTAAVTGATGFIGKRLASVLEADGWTVRRFVRQGKGAGIVGTGDLATADSLDEALAGCGTVYHLAGHAHVTRNAADDEAQFEAANHIATRRMAEAAARAGCGRFVFVSTIKVHGETTDGREPFGPADAPAPEDTYAQSKWRAEEALRDVAAQTGLAFAIVRPPLVFSGEASGNIARLVGLLRRGLPLPLAGIANRRSLIGLDNLAGLLAHLGRAPAIPGVPLLPHDITLSTPDLLRRVAALKGASARLFPLPAGLLEALLRAAGRSEDAARLFGSLEIAADALPAGLGWQPRPDGNPLIAASPGRRLS
ncbi:MAG: NAD-dependent epimerase/dehydratase family protein [Rhodobiaceae bacterium]|nr:NAD-dependent epimerase/dehydratase family protein [Rhodobiaceae bacterium]